MRLLAGAALSALVLAAAGCGSDEPGATPASEWAAGLCGAITAWTDALQSSADAFRDPGSLSVDSARAAIDETTSATQAFVDDLRGLGPPDTESGSQAKAELETLASTLESDAAELDQRLADAADVGVSGLLTAVSAITSTLTDMSRAVGETFTALGELDPGGELEDAVREAEACDPLVNA